MTAFVWSIVGFVLGAIPFSVWLGRLVLHADIRAFGDGNPGGTNVIRAGNRLLGVLVIVLDMLKAALPVSLAHYLFRVDGWPLVPVVLAPILGHVFSPFLRFRGGKGLAATFGAWTALTVPIGPFVMGGSVYVFYRLLKVSAWAVLASLLMLLGFLLIVGAKLPWLVAWAGTLLILIWTHLAEWRPGKQRQSQ